MGFRSRLTALMLMAILADNFPPARPPGAPPWEPEDVVKCPLCRRFTSEKVGGRYRCKLHGWFTPEDPADDEAN